jgi:3-hydroxy-9,10-secoandrosta-1,3,5(10)-triene-9,17-dione monooxygenase reductase component
VETVAVPEDEVAQAAGRRFRRVLGQVPTGVALITATTPTGPAGMAVNSFTSVSLDPPLVSFCAALTSSTWPRIQAAGAFSVNVLGEHHAEVSRRFAQKGADRFAGLGHRSGATGRPCWTGWPPTSTARCTRSTRRATT